jgi:predicted transcriptional regulator of viral defense system
MLRLTEKMLDNNWSGRVIRDIDIASVLNGSAAQRYGLVNKALKAKELVRLRRGLYVIGPKYNNAPLSQYYLANHLVPYSFVTAESALSFHGWIPERVATVISMTAIGRHKQYATPYSLFEYRVVPTIELSEFFMGVRCVEINDQLVWMATPLRALLDYLYWHKGAHVDFDFLKDSLRIDTENLVTITKEQIIEVENIYSVQRIKEFLKTISKEVNYATSHH